MALPASPVQNARSACAAAVSGLSSSSPAWNSAVSKVRADLPALRPVPGRRGSTNGGSLRGRGRDAPMISRTYKVGRSAGPSLGSVYGSKTNSPLVVPPRFYSPKLP